MPFGCAFPAQQTQQYSVLPKGIDGAEAANLDFMRQLDLLDFYERDSGRERLTLTAGQPVGSGLSAKAAAELGLVAETPVGSSVIDAYAGWVGTIATPLQGEDGVVLSASSTRLTASAGTSTVFIVHSPSPVFVKGIWGPWLHTIFPECELRVSSCTAHSNGAQTT